MDRWVEQNRRHQSYPSFSSTLLDDIYRSIDGEQDELVLYTGTMRKKRTTNSTAVNSVHRRDDTIEKWIEKKVSQKVVFRRDSSVPEFPKKSRSRRDGSSSSAFWGSSSSDSSSGGCFSSSELESVANGAVSSSAAAELEGCDRVGFSGFGVGICEGVFNIG